MEYRDALIMIDHQTERLTRIVEDMFTLARADDDGDLHVAEFYLDIGHVETAAASILAREGRQDRSRKYDRNSLSRR
jgi:signal transduction histidine kinase